MSRLLIWVLRLLPVVGLMLALAGSGLLGPVPVAGWDNGGFLVNLASSLTAACFGIPLAFFVLQKLLRERQVQDEKDRGARMAISNLEGLRSDLLAIHGLKSTGGQLRQVINDVLGARGDLIDMSNRLKVQSHFLGGSRSRTIHTISRTLPRLIGRLQRAPETSSFYVEAAKVRVGYHKEFVAENLFNVGLSPTNDAVMDHAARVCQYEERLDMRRHLDTLQQEALPLLKDLLDTLRLGDRISLMWYVANSSTLRPEVDKWLRTLDELSTRLNELHDASLPLNKEIDRLKRR